MYIAMNRFKIAKGTEEQFETIWKTRESRLSEMNGFVEFRLLKGAEETDHTLYASHTLWADYSDFKAWTESQQLKDAHKNSGKSKGVIMGHPQFEGFQTITVERNTSLAAAE